MASSDKGKKQSGSPGFNKKNSAVFLEKNRTKPGITVTDSGLQYLILEDANGISPGPDNSVLVHQRISRIDGTLIDDTYKQNRPAKFSMAEAIEGYREGLHMMSAGSRYRFFIPSDLAWGKRGAGNKIGPYAALIIDARLIEIK